MQCRPSEVEYAVFTVIDGPCRSQHVRNRPDATAPAFPVTRTRSAFHPAAARLAYPVVRSPSDARRRSLEVRGPIPARSSASQLTSSSRRCCGSDRLRLARRDAERRVEILDPLQEAALPAIRLAPRIRVRVVQVRSLPARETAGSRRPRAPKATTAPRARAPRPATGTPSTRSRSAPPTPRARSPFPWPPNAPTRYRVNASGVDWSRTAGSPAGAAPAVPPGGCGSPPPSANPGPAPSTVVPAPEAVPDRAPRPPPTARISTATRRSSSCTRPAVRAATPLPLPRSAPGSSARNSAGTGIPARSRPSGCAPRPTASAPKRHPPALSAASSNAIPWSGVSAPIPCRAMRATSPAPRCPGHPARAGDGTPRRSTSRPVLARAGTPRARPGRRFAAA